MPDPQFVEAAAPGIAAGVTPGLQQAPRSERQAAAFPDGTGIACSQLHTRLNVVLWQCSAMALATASRSGPLRRDLAPASVKLRGLSATVRPPRRAISAQAWKNEEHIWWPTQAENPQPRPSSTRSLHEPATSQGQPPWTSTIEKWRARKRPPKWKASSGNVGRTKVRG